MYKIRGKIIDSKTETIESKKGDTFEKMFITIVETESGFDHKHQFEIFGTESIDLHRDNIKIDKYAKIDFYIKSNEWKGKFFNTLNIKDIRVEEDFTKLGDSNLPFN
jgi:hypothetical protein|tara:strand:+ start:135 stop:455 length:321 start_codon:yes stop_codon:yes gene_type:complete